MAARKLSRAQRAHQKREGIVMLIVMLMLLMATGSAMFAIQSTQYEQRASTSIAEAAWARGVAECTTMAALAFAENMNATLISQMGLGTPWQDGTSARKYALPTPNLMADASSSMSFDVAPFVVNLPGGLQRFVPADRCPGCRYPMRQRYDGPDPGLHYQSPHWLMETITVPVTGGTRFRSIATGFGEVRVRQDPLDSSGVRELHEVDAISRGYMDRITPNPP